MAKARVSRIGILVECGGDGLEVVVCRRICDLLREEARVEIEVDIVPMSNKARLIHECGNVVSGLLADGCDRVVILWDERPAWPQMGDPLCWHNDRECIIQNLRQAQVADHSAYLVCIEREFESWLLYDDSMLSAVLSTDAHSVRVPAQKHPHRMSNPKGVMTSLFREHRGRPYVDIERARDFARCLHDLGRLRRCDTFRRFAQFVLGKMPPRWPPYVYSPRRRRNP